MKYLIVVALLLAQLAGCKAKEEKVSAEEARQFAASISKDIESRKMDFMERNIIIPVLIERIKLLTDIKYSAAVQKGIETALKKHEMERSILSSLENYGSFELVKQYEKEGKQRLVYRNFGTDGLNYLDIELTKLKKRVGIADIYIYLSGENFSKSMAEMFKQLKLDDKTNDVDNTITQFQKVKQLVKDNNFKMAKTAFDKLPTSLKQTRMGGILNLQIASNLNDEAYLEALELLEKKYGDEAGFQLSLIDFHLLKKDYNKALAAIDKVDKQINKDPMLDYYRGLIYGMDNDDKQSAVYHERAIQSIPDLAEAYPELVLIYAETDKEKAQGYFKTYKTLKRSNPAIAEQITALYPFLLENN